MEDTFRYHKNGKEFRISSIVLQPGGFYLARDACDTFYENAMDETKVFAWMRERWGHLHEHTMLCEEGRCFY